MMEFMQRPCGMYAKSHLSEEEKVQAITIMATASDRLIRTAMLDITGGSQSNINSHPGYVDNHGVYDSSYDDNIGYDDGDGGGDDGGGE